MLSIAQSVRRHHMKEYGVVVSQRSKRLPVHFERHTAARAGNSVRRHAEQRNLVVPVNSEGDAAYRFRRRCGMQIGVHTQQHERQNTGE